MSRVITIDNYLYLTSLKLLNLGVDVRDLVGDLDDGSLKIGTHRIYDFSQIVVLLVNSRFDLVSRCIEHLLSVSDDWFNGTDDS